MQVMVFPFQSVAGLFLHFQNQYRSYFPIKITVKSHFLPKT